MRCLIPCTVVAVVVAVCGNCRADDKTNSPKSTTSSNYYSVSEIESVVLSATPGDKGSSISLKLDQKLLANAANLGSAIEMPHGKPAQQMKDMQKDVKLELISEVVVRRLHLPPKKDEKGHTVAYTEKERKELKGDSSLKGYNADLSDLKAGQTVTIHLVKLKGAKGDDAKKVFVSRVFIISEAPTSPPVNNNKKQP
jgi:hypothetical protein